MLQRSIDLPNALLSRNPRLLALILMLPLLLVVSCSPKRPARGREESDLLIGKISFVGTEAIKEGQLKKAMRIIAEGDEYSEYKIKVALENVLYYYKTKGFFHAEVVSQKGQYFPEKNRIDLEFIINEGAQEIIESITFIGNETVADEELYRNIIVRKGDPYDYLKIFTSKYNIQSIYASRGYIYAEVSTSPEDSFLLNKNLTFTLNEGKQVFVEKVLIKGNRKVRTRIIEREILIKPGDIYSPQRIHASQQKIYATGLFYDVKFEIVGVDEQKDHVTIVFEVLEGKTRWVSFGGAFQTPNRITTDLGWGHDNLFNNNQSISINYIYTFNFEDEKLGHLEVNYTEPYLLSVPVRLGLRLFNEREVTYRILEDSRSQYFSNIYGIHSRLGYSVNLSTEITTEIKLKKAFINVIGDYKPQKDYVTNSVTFAYSQDTRDNIFNPRRGVLSLTSIEFAGSILRGDNHFVRYVQDISMYRRFTKRSIIASKIKIGYTVPIEGTTGSSISVDERFELGGPSSLRGYAESSIGTPDIRGKRSGIYLINGGEELRFPIYKLLGGAAFIDWGGLWIRKGDIRISALKVGIGFGVRYNTVIGPIRLDYGYRLTDRTPRYKGNVYFAIGNAF
jgi:outer membrane protein insertion porin family